ncbi:folylpolyglutamate synthase/dihydrofolate synthase family protein [Sphingomonas sp. gentR]|jgi:dihydrofolate synthase/folylpolyglutamate synthase|uniref:bifunctional folylpolyglutamate synthase/dihydrofolate synthase n=1 Tax=unclassified Sphingomonas TaxID=196159 RepID=UPI0009729226|nr:folylpolyglutamate synthase/dihydrofolate synthase family protein [Sphingomonas sp. LK11]APX66253.1 bifunctional folylpolyglutamate synthase/dihydrofolate synthase [Sphingomonas sp. LK11]
MPDHARSDHPAVQAQLDRLWSLSPGADVLGLERITTLLGRLGDPQHHLPPVFHVAGTNGKGSTCAFLRAAIEASGQSVHVYSSPHLVRFNERIRLNGRLITDDALAAVLDEVLGHAEGIGASFFEVTTAAAFLSFARNPAAATIIEVGLGGRLDATNILPPPAVCGIAALGIDHEAFLGRKLTGIAREKAGIAKRGTPLVTMDYARPLRDAIAEVAAAAGAPVFARGQAWSSAFTRSGVSYEDKRGQIALPRPSLTGGHQSRNLALAVAMLRHQQAVTVSDEALRQAATGAQWPARMQRLRHGPLTQALPAGTQCWLDGAHNPSAATPVARTMAGWRSEGPTALILGMLANKEAGPVLEKLGGMVDLIVTVPVPDHACHAPESLAQQAHALGLKAISAGDPSHALALVAERLEAPSHVLIAGSLYLAGQVLAQNDEAPQ